MTRGPRFDSGGYLSLQLATGIHLVSRVISLDFLHILKLIALIWGSNLMQAKGTSYNLLDQNHGWTLFIDVQCIYVALRYVEVHMVTLSLRTFSCNKYSETQIVLKKYDFKNR